MSREATSFEATVTGENLNLEDGSKWIQISYSEPVPAGKSEPSTVPTSAPGAYLSVFIRKSELPGVEVGDKVQVALYLK